MPKRRRYTPCPYCGKEVLMYENPVSTVDIIVNRNGKVLLVERKNPPHGYALPGGFVEYGETLEYAAARELKEETGLDVVEMKQFHSYSDPKRDHRLHTISTVFIASTKGKTEAMDDAKSLDFFSLDDLPMLCFDHSLILEDYKKYIMLNNKTLPTETSIPICLDKNLSTFLTYLVKRAINYHMRHKSLNGFKANLPEDKNVLSYTPYGLFVTLKKLEALRGCIGVLDTKKPLYELVCEMAIQAAFFDPRFTPISLKEVAALEVEISILFCPSLIKNLELLQIGKHGLILEKGIYKGLLLPQVATEQHFDQIQFMEAVSIKAGLHKDAWESFDVKISIFEAYVVKEPKKA